MPLETCEEQNAASAALAEWWGDFVPIDQWTPPRVRHQFQDLNFKRYDMSSETQIETLDSHHGDSTPDIYDWCFAGMEESIKELSSMFDVAWRQHAANGQAPTSESTHDDEEADELFDDGPSFDLGWNILPAASLDDVPTVDNRSTTSSASDGDEEGPAYDLGWGVQATAKLRSSSPLTPMPSSPAPMDLDYDDRRPSPKEEDLYNARPAEQSMLQENRRLKAIGNDMSDKHMHAIVENAVHGLNSSRVPAQILMENRHILGGFAEARNRVTEVGKPKPTITGSSLSDRTIDVYRADMQWEDYALVSLLCGGDYDIGRWNPALADNISKTVPDLNIWLSYLNPAISKPLVPIREPGVPHLAELQV
ncbi:hypothetical protein EV702DRAFT_1193506 [Suillus placidus]|uniref:Uncharacterized protein n=1 Tax=Suillus placidus TaxID=48579 RepID=A0A9P7A306_9AGAM|nr:hypothetical protein EV702DRAFT_1193506 [Suillus placidus]